MKENKLRFHLDNDLPLVSTRLWSTNAFFWEAVGQTGKFWQNILRLIIQTFPIW